MKASAFVSIASLAWVSNASSAESLGGLATWEQAPQGQRIIPRLDQSEPIDGANRTELFYGPYTVPAGEMVNTGGQKEAPCKNCYVTAMFATIKYLNGKEALTSEGAWLHHTVLRSRSTRAVWAAGNERPTIRLNSEFKYGIDWGDQMSYTVDVMSEKKEPMEVYMSITYEYISKNSDMGRKYKKAEVMWIQTAYAKPKDGKTTYKSLWSTTSSVNGKLLYTIGHMHDGGTNLRLFINDKPVCDSIMYYDGGEKGLVKASDWVSKKGSGPHHKSAALNGLERRDGSFGTGHIASPGACTNYGSVKRGDSLRIEAFYDFDKFEKMAHKGKEESLMGNCRVYIGPE